MGDLVSAGDTEAATASYTSGRAYAELDAAIDAAQAIEQESFDEAAGAAADAARLLDEINLLSAAGIVLLALLGLFQRLREYPHEPHDGRGRPALAVLAALATGATAVAGCSGGSSASCPPSEIPDHDENTLVIEGDAWSGYAPFRDGAARRDRVHRPLRRAGLPGRAGGRPDSRPSRHRRDDARPVPAPAPRGHVGGGHRPELGADALALGTANHPELDSIDDLPALVAQFAEDGDKPVLAYTGNSPSEMLLNELANTTDELRLADFELVSVDQSATAFEMLEADEAQLAVIWEPDTSAARAGRHTVALSSADVPDAIVDVIVASDRLIERDPAAVQAVVAAYYSTMDDLLARPAALEQFYATDGGLDAETARTLIAGIELYGSNDANVFMNDVFPLDKPQIQQSIDAIGSVLALIHPDIPLDQAKVDGVMSASSADRGKSSRSDRRCERHGQPCGHLARRSPFVDQRS